MGGRRACVLTELSQGAVEGGGERACGLGSNQHSGSPGDSAALGVGIVVVACLSRLGPSRAGARGARRRAAKGHWPSRPALATLWHPYWHPEVGDDEGLILSVTRLRGLASGYLAIDTLPEAGYLAGSNRIQHARYIKIRQENVRIRIR